MTGDPPPHALLRPAIALPFVLIGLIWGSTWWVITEQLDGTPPAWSVAWRFVLAAPAMFLLAAVFERKTRISPAAHGIALIIGLTQFCANYNLIYHAEAFVTSGIVAVLASLMIVPNALLARWLLGQRVTPSFAAGSAVAIAGVALLLLHEWREARQAGDVILGLVLAGAGLLAASLASVIQAHRAVRGAPILTLIAWAMLYGALGNLAVAWLTAGPPVLPDRPGYRLGLCYLAIVGSVATFPMYYRLVRALGAGRAAYVNVLILIVAMAFSTALEDYRWSPLAIAGSLLAMAGLVIALRARSPAT